MIILNNKSKDGMEGMWEYDNEREIKIIERGIKRNQSVWESGARIVSLWSTEKSCLQVDS